MLKGQKTYVVAVVGIITAIAAYLTGDMTLAQTGQAVLTSLLGITIRHAVS